MIRIIVFCVIFCNFGSRNMVVYKNMRKRIYEIIEQGHSGDNISIAYDVLMLVAITASIVPLMFVEENAVFLLIEHVTVAFFIFLSFSISR